MDLVKLFSLFFILGVLGTSSASFGQTCDPGADGITPVGGGPQQLANGDVCANNSTTPALMKILYTNVEDGGDPNNVEFFIDWDDGTTQTLRYALGEITQPPIPPNSYEATVTHSFPPNGGAVQCEYVPTTFLQFNGTACAGSAANPPAFVRWNTDDQLTGQHLVAEQATGNNIYEVCAGESVTVRFSDQSTFNCVPPAYLNLVNDRTRWTQFIYGTNNTITSATGVEVAGTVEAYPLNGAVLSQATPVVAPFGVTLDITVPNDALVGQEFEITMNSWNFCNRFTDGDPPIVTTGIIRIIDSPAAPVVPPTDFCVGQDPTTAAAGGGGVFTWYTDLGLSNVAHVGNPFDPTTDPAPVDQLSNLVPGSKTYYVTETLGVNNCEGPATAVLFNIIENPTASAAGADFSVCTATSALSANTPIVGAGVWTSSGPGVADAPINPLSTVSGLVSGTTTTFTWTITNGGICVDASTVDVTRDLPPSPADAGPDISLCTGTSVNMNAVVPAIGIGTWSVIAGPGNVLLGDENLPSATIENLIPGAFPFTMLQWEVNNLTCTPPTIPANTSTVQIINFLDPASEAGDPIFICDPLTIGTLSADDPTILAPLATGLWTVAAGPGNVVLGDETLFNADIENLVLGTPTIFTWTVTNGVCVDPDDVIVTIEAAPTVSTATTPFPIICSATSTVAGEVPLSGTGLWSVDAGTGNIVVGEEGFITANVENIAPGTTTTFRWTISTVSCAISSATVDITNTSPTTSLAGLDQNVCVATATLTGNAAGGGETGTWTSGGPGIVDFPNDPNSTISFLVSGTTTTFTWTIDNVVCPVSTSTIDITRDLPPSTSIAGLNQSVCAATAVLAGNTPAVGTGLWTSAGPGTVDDPLDPLSGVSNLAVGTTTTFTWTISNGTCANNLSTVQITRDTQPTTSAAGPDQNVCTATATLAANTVGFGETGVWTSGGPGVVDFPNSEVSTVSGLVQGTTTTFTWTITNGGSCSASASNIGITYDQSPTVSIAGTDQNVCLSTGLLGANNPVVGVGIWTSSGPGVVDSPGNRNSTVSSLVQGTTTTFTWTITNGTCAASASSLDVTFNDFPTTANAGTDQIICGNSTTLAANDVSLGIGTGNWDFAFGGNPDGLGAIASPLLFNSGFTGTEGIIYDLEWTVSNGACAPSVDDLMVVFAPAIPAITISGDLATCVGDITTYVIPSGDPATYNYNWDISGLPATTTVVPGTGTPFQFISLQFADPTVAAPLSVEVENKVSLCVGPPEVINITVYETPLMSLISSDIDLTICENDLVTFTATDALGIADNFEFKLNGITVQSGPSNIYITTALPIVNSLTVTGTAPGGICPAVSAPPIIHVVNVLPAQFNVSGGGSYCAGGVGVLLGLDGSEVGISYELYLDGLPTGITDSPGGGAFDFPLQTLAGVYTIEAVTVNSCGIFMAGNTVINIDPLPAVFNITGGGDVCEASLGTPIGLDGSEIGVNYQLVQGGVPIGLAVAGTGAAISFGNQITTATYTATALNPITFCAENMAGNAVITVYDLPLAAPTNAAADICTGGTTNIDLNSDIPGSTFTWLAVASDIAIVGEADELAPQPIGTIISQTLTNTDTSPHTVIYFITPTGPLPTNCVGIDEMVQVTVHPSPAATIAGTTSICLGSAATLTFEMTGTVPFDIQYTDGTSTFDLDNVASPHVVNVTPTVTTDYSIVSVTDLNGCSVASPPSIATITVEEAVAAFSTTQPTSGCSPYAITFTNDNISTGVEYIWSWNDGTENDTTTNEMDITHEFFNNSTTTTLSYSIVMTAVNSNVIPACTDIASIIIEIFPTVAVSILPDSYEGCAPHTINFDNSSLGAISHRWYYREKGTTDVIDERTTETVAYEFPNTTTAPIIYEVVYEGFSLLCTQVAIEEVTIYPELSPTFTVDPGPFVLFTDMPHATITNTTPNAAAWDYNWQYGDTNSSSLQDPAPYSYGNFGVYDITLTLSDPNSFCIAEESFEITVSPTFPEVDFVADVTTGCRPLTVSFTNLSQSVDPETYSWEFIRENGMLEGVSTFENPSITFFEPGLYTVSLSGSNPLGITDVETKDFYIEVQDRPQAEFSVRPTTVYLPDMVLSTSNLSSGSDKWLWDFGDSSEPVEDFEPTHEYGSPGVYSITLVASNMATGCADTLRLENMVTVEEGGTTRVPNAFTPSLGGPNPSGYDQPGTFNDNFRPYVAGVLQDGGYKLQIFERWGNLIFESTDPKMGWDGYDKFGNLLHRGVYVYKLDLKFSTGQEVSKIGDVTLIR